MRLKSHSGLYKIVPGKAPARRHAGKASDVEKGAENLKEHIENVLASVFSRSWQSTFPTDFESERDHPPSQREAGARVIHRGVAENWRRAPTWRTVC